MKSDQSAIFHLSIHVRDLQESRRFYGEVLGCSEARSAETWVDFDFFGHQLSLHLGTPTTHSLTGQVDSIMVPMPHFGAVLPDKIWHEALSRLRDANANFVLDPQERYPGQTGAQHTLFVLDPSNNAIELKRMVNPDELFSTQPETAIDNNEDLS